ncbi:MAG: ComEC/Rec2 family competence protein [Patescibacteria group bacterium]
MKTSLFLWICLGALDLCLAIQLSMLRPHLQLHVLDVGQGDAILLTTPDQHHVLVDGGPGQKVLEELGEVLPLGFEEIDLLVLTHPHADHMEGLIPVLQRFKVKAILMTFPEEDGKTYEAFLSGTVGIPIYNAEAEMDFKLGNVVLNVLYPFESISGESLENLNNASPVIRVETERVSVLLTGDAEQEVEAELLAAGVDVSADILKAGHHGSRTSSTRPFLEAVDPEIMIISCGTDNDYGHPHKETLQKAEDLGMEVLRTDKDGRISLIFDQASWTRSILAPRLRSFSSKPS